MVNFRAKNYIHKKRNTHFWQEKLKYFRSMNFPDYSITYILARYFSNSFEKNAF